MNKIPEAKANNYSFFFSSLGIMKNVGVAGLFCPPIYLTRKGAELTHWGSSYLVKTPPLNELGKLGQKIAEELFHSANRIQLIFYDHRMDNASALISKTEALCLTRNNAKIEVIWSNEDVKKYQELLKKYIEQKPIESTEAELLEMSKYTLQGANTDGICQGASLFVIHALQGTILETEEQLVQFIKPWEEGFPAVAAALHNIYGVWLKVHVKRAMKEAKPLLDKLEISKWLSERKLSMSQRITNMYEIAGVWESTLQQRGIDQNSLNSKYEKEIDEEERTYKEELNRDQHRFCLLKVTLPAQLIGLKLKKDANSQDQVLFKDIVNNDLVQDKFDQLDYGNYLLTIDSHARVYIKRDFGSYILDPNYGLLKCSPLKPSEKLCELFIKNRTSQSHTNSKNDYDLKVFSF
jgi:phosphotransferase system IIB component